MQAIARIVSPKAPLQQPSMTITTTLYDLLEAIHEEVPAGSQGEKLATEVVVHLLDSGRIHFIGDPHRLDAS
jgi:hypothetical protein